MQQEPSKITDLRYLTPASCYLTLTMCHFATSGTVGLGRKEIQPLHYEDVIIGSGPGGATVARELARAGLPLIIYELIPTWRAA